MRSLTKQLTLYYLPGSLLPTFITAHTYIRGHVDGDHDDVVLVLPN